METIKSYLENMFLNLPKTREVYMAKMELAQMMEDKYNELLAEGKTDNEAVGIVISEFGNLSELAESLGIHDYVKNNNYAEVETLSLDTVKKYISEKIKSSIHIAVAVMLLIMSLAAVVVVDSLAWLNGTSDMLGGLVFFVGIAIAVGMIVYDSIRMGKWKMFGKGTKRLDFAAESYVKEQMENFRATYALYITLGVVLCITSVVPAMVMGEISWRMNDFSMDDIAGALFLVMVAVGVMFFILGGMRKGCYEGLLQENQVVMNKEKEHQKELEKNILSVYWPTVTCIYLIWSFLTMDWYISWIIWPIAAVVERIIKLICSEKK
ncbi:MAG: permease prefix domain 1-containing protein [Lachnospiraceae bacterium]|nr:permease prefix domain 1-containing protein [Lachnospiraceae bacterium]